MLRRLTLLIIAVTVAAGCSRSSDFPSGLENSDVDSASKRGKGVCRLLGREEVEVAMNSGAGPVSKARPILVGMQMCSLSNSGSTALASWGVLSKYAADAFDRYSSWHADYLKTVRDIGDEAVWDEKLGTILVLQGNRVVGVALAVKDPPVTRQKDRERYAEDTAKSLAAKALRRL